MDTITLDNIDLSTIPPDIANIPEKIGYLSEIGLNYGWGPTSMLEWVMEHFHIYAGLPWWGSIAATAVLLRVVLFPLYLRASDVTARQSALVPVTKPINDKMSAAQRAQNTQEVMLAWQQLRAIRAKAGISFSAQFAPIIFQGIFGYCGFKLLRAASFLPVPAFATDGPLWLSDLTVPDPYLLLPIAMGGCIHLLARIGGETGAQAMTPGMKNAMLYVMPVIIALLTGWQPGAVCVWFAAGGALGIAQSLSLQRPAVRKFFGIAPLYRPPKGQEYKNPVQAWAEANLSGDRKAVKETVEVKGTSRPAFEAAAGKNEEFMRPTYQSPNLRRTPSARAASTAASESLEDSGEMILPSTAPPKQEGVFDKASKAYTSFRGRIQDEVRERTEEKERGDVDKRMRAESEKRARLSQRQNRSQSQRMSGGRQGGR